MKSKIAILASGNGTTAEAFIRATQDNKVDGEVVLVITNNKDAGIIERVKKLNEEFNLSIQTVVINSKTHPSEPGEDHKFGRQTKAEQRAIIDTIKISYVDLVVNMGYMKMNGPAVVHEFGWRPEYVSPYQACFLNTHPGLLPATKGFYGMYVQEHILAEGLSEAGQTLHVVSENYDDGPTVAENKVPVEPGDTAETLFARVQEIEKKHLPADIDAFIKARQAYLEGK